MITPEFLPENKSIITFSKLSDYVPLSENLKVIQPLNRLNLYTSFERDLLYKQYLTVYNNLVKDEQDEYIYNFLKDTYNNNQFDVFDSIMVIIMTSYYNNFYEENIKNSTGFSEHYETLKQRLINYKNKGVHDIVIEYDDICDINKIDIITLNNVFRPTSKTLYNKYYKCISFKYIEIVSLIIYYYYIRETELLIDIIVNINPPAKIVLERNDSRLTRTYSVASLNEDQTKLPVVIEKSYRKAIKHNMLIKFILYGIMYCINFVHINGLQLINLKVNKINKKVINSFLNYLEHSLINTIKLDNIDINEGINNVLMPIIRNPNVIKLVVNNFSIYDIRNVSELLSINVTLIDLSFKNVWFHTDINDNLNSIYDALCVNNTLKSLTLKNLHHGHKKGNLQCSSNLINMLNTNESLLKLNLSNNDLTSLFNQHFINALKTNTNISYLYIHNSYLYDNCFDLINLLLSVNKLLIELSVGKPIYIVDHKTLTHIDTKLIQ